MYASCGTGAWQNDRASGRNVLPPLPVRQWCWPYPKRLRYFLHDDAAVQGVVLRILLRVVERVCASTVPVAAPRHPGAVVFIHRFGSSLNAHLHFHCCIIDRVFEPAGDNAAAGVVFHAASGLDAAAIAAVQARVRQRVLCACVRRGLLDQSAAADMGEWDHGGGFSVDASVRIEGADRTGLERLLRYCARRRSPRNICTRHRASGLPLSQAAPGWAQ